MGLRVGRFKPESYDDHGRPDGWSRAQVQEFGGEPGLCNHQNAHNLPPELPLSLVSSRQSLPLPETSDKEGGTPRAAKGSNTTSDEGAKTRDTCNQRTTFCQGVDLYNRPLHSWESKPRNVSNHCEPKTPNRIHIRIDRKLKWSRGPRWKLQRPLLFDLSFSSSVLGWKK